MDNSPVNEQLYEAFEGGDRASVRKGGRPQFIDFRPLVGAWVALPYSSMLRVEFDPNKTVAVFIQFATHTVSISGVNLESLYLQLVAQRVGVVAQRSEFDAVGEAAAAVVHTLAIRERKRSASGLEHADSAASAQPASRKQ